MTSPASLPYDPRSEDPGLSAVEGLLVGHGQMSERPTGCTVVLTLDGATAGVDVRGGAPGSRELALLDPIQTVQQVHAVVLAGGSAYGLAAANGVVSFLESRGVGFPTGGGLVPIVPASILYDLEVGARPDVRPDAACGERAAAAASSRPVQEGNVGAGAGASVGKLRGAAHAMRGGLGSASIQLSGGVTVAALIAVNAFGDVVDPNDGRLIAGTRDDSGHLVDARTWLYGGQTPDPLGAGCNTTIGVVATNAALSKAEASKVASMAQDGLARTLYPAHTPFDGDTLYALSTGQRKKIDIGTLGAVAADMVARAVIRAVFHARGLPGLPAVHDLAP